MSEELKECQSRCVLDKPIKNKLFSTGSLKRCDLDTKTHLKVSIIGCGKVGISCAVALLFQKITNHIILVDVKENLIKTETENLLQGTPFFNYHIESCTDYSKCIGSKIVIITAGVRDGNIDENIKIFKNIIPNLVKYCSKSILLVVSNPCDLLTYVAWKLSGFPRHRVIGSGTLLDSNRFRYIISERLGVDAKFVKAVMIGGHGDHSVPLWSGVSVNQIRVRDLDSTFGRSEEWKKVHQEVIDAEGVIQQKKGFDNWGIGASVAKIVDIILYDRREIVPVSVFAKGVLRIKQDVTLSLPCVLGSRGVVTILKTTFSKDEHEELIKSAKILYEIIEKISI